MARVAKGPTIEQGPSLIKGSAAAAILASGIGCLMIGIMTTLAEASPAISSALNFVNPVGPLSGKTTVAIVVWLVAWAALHSAWHGRERSFSSVFTATLVLIALGVLGTFPLFFDLFAPS